MADDQYVPFKYRAKEFRETLLASPVRPGPHLQPTDTFPVL